MAHLNLNEITEIAADAARHVSADIRVVGVTTGSGGGGEYVEALLNIEGCHKVPCQLSLGLFRNLPRSAIQLSIEGKLRAHMAEQNG